MNEDEIKLKNSVIIHKDNSLNRLDLSFLKHIELSELEKIEDVPVNIQNIIEKEQKYIAKMEQEISKMKKDSIALINQITTISKQRIF